MLRLIGASFGVHVPPKVDEANAVTPISEIPKWLSGAEHIGAGNGWPVCSAIERKL